MNVHTWTRSCGLLLLGLLLSVGVSAAPNAPVSWRTGGLAVARDGVGNWARFGGAARTRGGIRMVGANVPVSGVVHVLAIPVEFQTDASAASSGTGNFPYRSWGPTAKGDDFTSNLQHVANYYQRNSGGRVTMQFKLTQVVQLSGLMSVYTAADDGGIMQEVVALADAQIDFSWADMILLIHAGCGGEFTGSAGDIHSHFMGLYGTGFDATVTTNDGVAIAGYCLVPETACSDEEFVAVNSPANGPKFDIIKYEQNPSAFPGVLVPHWSDVTGVWAHEMGHAFGLPDLYVVTNLASGVNVGEWTLMAEGCYKPSDTNANVYTPYHKDGEVQYYSVPAHMDAWSKQFLGWTTVINVTDTIQSTDTAPEHHMPMKPQATSTGFVYRMADNSDAATREYFLLENRAQVGDDQYLSEGGLMIYHIDDSVGTIANNDVQGSISHPRVLPVSADGVLELDNTTPNQLTYKPIVNTVFPGAVEKNTHLGSTTTPSSNGFNGLATSVDVSNIHIVGTDVYATLRTAQSTVITFTNPTDGATINTTRPTLRATAMHLVPGATTLYVNGTQYAFPDNHLDTSGLLISGYDAATGEIAFPFDGTNGRPTLAAGNYSVIINGQDQNTQAQVSGTLSFTVAEKRLSAGKWLITLPATNVGTARNVFSAIDPTQLNLWRWNPLAESYVSYPHDAVVPAGNYTELTSGDPVTDTLDGAAYDRVAPNDTVAPAGKGYFLQLKSDVALRLDGDLVQAQRQYAINLYSGPDNNGFNLIGNPYTAPVTFSNLQVEYNGTTYSIADAVSAQLLDPVLYGWDGTSYTLAILPNGMLQPWQGYWVRARVGSAALPLRLIFSPVPAQRSAVPPARTAAAGSGWLVNLQAATPASGAVARLQVGISRGATAQVDPGLDFYAPPAMPDALGLASVAGRAALVRDVQALDAAGNASWALNVTAPAGSQVVLSWPDLTSLPATTALTLTDPATGDARYLRTAASYTLTLGAQETSRQLRLTATPLQRGALQVRGLQARHARGGDGYEISGELTQEATVALEIRSLTGRLVTRIAGAAYAPGTLTLRWDGRTATGQRVPRGVYHGQVSAITREGLTVKADVLLPQ